jgi:hypothetical protein
MRRLLALWQSLSVGDKTIFGVLAAAIAKGAFDLGRLLWFYATQNPINWDTLVYLTIGRGILNGIKPYVGLYEMKPPGIFLISALSLALTGDPRFGLWLQMIGHVLTVALIGWGTWKLSHGAVARHRLMLTLAGMAFGFVVALYAESRHIAFQSEGFGFVFALLYVVAIALPGRMTLLRTLTAALGIVGSLGMKEPFVFAALAAGLVLSDHDKPL